MKRFCLLFLGLQFAAYPQDNNVIKERLNTYLNFRKTLNPVIVFKDGKTIVNWPGAKQKFVIGNNEDAAFLQQFFQRAPLADQVWLIKARSQESLTKKQTDSIREQYSKTNTDAAIRAGKPLSGLKIAIDPGHFAVNLDEAASEQKYLYFASSPGDTVKIFESKLTFNTAQLLKKMLEDKGAEVKLTRDAENYTSFNCTYTDWIKTKRKTTLDEMLANGEINRQRYTKLISAKPYELFWNFFRDYDLMNRAKKVNEFKPDITIIIHYNVDEKNAPWKKTSRKNFTMTFIGGAFTPKDLGSDVNKADFMRLLLTNQLKESEKLSALTVNEFNRLLGIPKAGSGDADYLLNNCIAAPSGGVFCRNLVLCRKINSPLVYGEALFQDNEKECRELMKWDKELMGIKTNARLLLCAEAYFNAVLKYYGKE